MRETIKERLKQLKKNGNVVNVLADTYPTTMILNEVTVSKVREDHAVFRNSKTGTYTAVAFKQLKDVVY